MRIIGCLDGTNVEQITHAVQAFFGAEAPAVALLTVIDTGPRHDIERMRERLMRPPMGRKALTDEMLAAETAAAREILDAGTEYLKGAETLLQQGRPELEIVNAAAEWKADLILIGARAEFGEPPHIGPKSVGHVARFVLDHAPCPVLLLRPLARKQFPIDR